MFIIEIYSDLTGPRDTPTGELIWQLASSHTVQSDAEDQLQRFIEQGIDPNKLRSKKI